MALALLVVAAVLWACGPTQDGAFFQWQLDCQRVDTRYKAFLYSIDGFCATAEDVAAIHAQSYPVPYLTDVLTLPSLAICHIDVGVYDPNNRDPESAAIAAIRPTILGGTLSGADAGKRFVDVRRRAELEPHLRSRIARCVSRGFDGIEPEMLEAYRRGGGGFAAPITDAQQLDFNRYFAELVHSYTALSTRMMKVIQRGAHTQTAQLAEHYDWLLMEDCVAGGGFCDAAQPYINVGKLVMDVEYSDSFWTETTGGTDGFCNQLVARNISGQLKRRGGGKERVACGLVTGADRQRTGAPVRGRQLLLDNGTEAAPYLSCGIPRRAWDFLPADEALTDQPRIAGRKDATLPYFLSTGTSPATGVEVVNTNCLLCHAAPLGPNGDLHIGMPNATRDFTALSTLATGIPGVGLDLISLGLWPNERAELDRVRRVLDAQARFPVPDTIGVNPADMVFTVLAAHRDPLSLGWNASPSTTLTKEQSHGIFIDVPPWWLMHRRDRMFHTGFGRGDHARIMMTASLLCTDSTQEAERIDAYFPDIRAYIMSLRAPKYTETTGRPIDATLAATGRQHYEQRCVRCHGGKDGEGPEPLPFVAIEDVGTDPYYSMLTMEAAGPNAPKRPFDVLFDFFNASWMSSHAPGGRLERTTQLGYSPPPLDGIWATAPYFHNGSVPTLEALLNADSRPRMFVRSFKPAEYDYQALGWPFREVTSKGTFDTNVYDTNQPGFGKDGHTFARDLPPDARRALLEYLKTF